MSLKVGQAHDDKTPMTDARKPDLFERLMDLPDGVIWIAVLVLIVAGSFLVTRGGPSEGSGPYGCTATQYHDGVDCE